MLAAWVDGYVLTGMEIGIEGDGTGDGPTAIRVWRFTPEVDEQSTSSVGDPKQFVKAHIPQLTLRVPNRADTKNRSSTEIVFSAGVAGQTKIIELPPISPERAAVSRVGFSAASVHRWAGLRRASCEN